MTTRLKAVLVTFDQDLREDDAEAIINAIRCVKHVADVSPIPTNPEDHAARSRVRAELSDKILGALRETLAF